MLLASCVNTPIDHNVFQNLRARVARCSPSYMRAFCDFAIFVAAQLVVSKRQQNVGLHYIACLSKTKTEWRFDRHRGGKKISKQRGRKIEAVKAARSVCHVACPVIIPWWHTAAETETQTETDWLSGNKQTQRDGQTEGQTHRQINRETDRYSFLSVKNLVGRAVCPPQRLRRTHKLRPH